MWKVLSRGSLRGRLLVLVVVPLSFSALSVGGEVVESREDVRSSTRAESALSDLNALSSARTALVQETVPAFSQFILRDPALVRSSGFDPASASRLGNVMQLQLTEAQDRTDRALEAVPADSDAGAAAAAVRQDLRRLRVAVAGRETGGSSADRAGDLMELYVGYDRLTHVLLARERVELADALTGAVDATVLRALSDLQLVSGAGQTGDAELPLLLGTRIPLVAVQPAHRRAWLTYWGAYRFTRMQMEGLMTPVVRQAWDQARADPALVAFEAVSDEAVGAGTDARDMSVDEMITLQLNSTARDAALGRVLQVAGDQALEQAASSRVSAQTELRSSAVLAALGGLLALALVALVGEWIGRPLRRLAQDATHVSRGRLVEVTQSGPREVRTAARALGATVSALRRVEDQAGAVARGELHEVTQQEPLPGPLGATVHQSLVSIVAAIHQREELQTRLAHQAAHDQLTSLPNRAQALRLITGALHRAQRAGTAVAVLFVDLDHFKQINDTHGHASGDAVLQAVSGRMEALVRSGDVVCRLGGDEFVILVEPADDDPRGMLELAHRIIASIAEPVEAAGRLLQVGASIGIAVSRDGRTDPDHLLAEADAAAYRAKAAGRGTAELFDEALRTELADRSALEDAMRTGLERGEFLLHYQPVIDVATGELCSFEALMRWDRPGHGLVSPVAFIPVAEQSNLIADLGRWALQEATRQLVSWTSASAAAPVPDATAGAVDSPQRRVGEHVTMAVNLSGRHLDSVQVVDDVREALDRSGLPAHRLVLELTETTVVDDPIAFERLATLRQLGVSVAIDDFGTGYTSIGQLQHLPADTLKIDRSFITSDEPRYRELVRLIVSAAHTFGLRVVAEGVEQAHQLQVLQDLGCDEAQGFLIARPTAPEAIRTPSGSDAAAPRR